jgi:hypothetical protein
MDSDIEQLGHVVAAIMLAGVGVFTLLQALRSRRRTSAADDQGNVEAAPD